MKRTGIVPRNILVDAALPAATATYTVISHGFIINSILQTLNAKGFTVSKEQYTCSENAQIATGVFHINYGNDPDLGMLFAFSNSYNKLLRFRCAVGAYVKINGMSVLGETGNAWIRKHTGTADDEALAVIEKQIEDCAIYFNQLAEDKEVMKQIKLNQRQYGELLGRLYIDNKIINGEQLAIIKKEYEKPSYTYTTESNSLWTLYNHILVALSRSHPRTWMEQQKIVHMHLTAEYDLVVFDDDDTILPEMDTNQTNLLDAIAEVENTERPAELTPEPETEVSQEEEKVMAEEVAEVLDAEELDIEAEESAIGSDFDIDTITTEDTVDAIEESIEEPVAEIAEEVEEAVVPEEISTPEPEVSRPTMTIEAAIEKYGHMLTADELDALKKLEPTVIAKMKQIITDGFAKESEAVAIPQTLPVQGLPTGLPKMPVINQVEEPIEDEVEQIENTIEDTVHEVEAIIDDQPFFIAKADVDEMYPGTDIEAGFVVTLMDNDFEVLSITDTQYELVMLKADFIEDTVDAVVDLDAEDDAMLDAMLTPIEHVTVPELSLSERREAIDKEIALQNATEMIETEEDDTFDLGDPIEMVPAESMLRKPTVEEEAKADEVIAIIESKPSTTEADRKIQKVISEEIFNLYDEYIDFTYVLGNGQYNVTLTTGEVIILTEQYINDLINNANE
jgi:hypothetical protein